MKAFFLFLSILPVITSWSQLSSKDSVTLKLRVTTTSGEAIETVVSFEDQSTHKLKYFKTGKDGMAICKLFAAVYLIKIPVSNDSYEYGARDLNGLTSLIELKFALKEKEQLLTGIKVYNNPGVNNISIRSKRTSSEVYKVGTETSYMQLTAGEEYYVLAKGVEIKNNFIKPGPGDNVSAFILNFIDSSHAELLSFKSDQSVIQVIYQNLNDEPLKNETVTIKGTGSEIRLVTGSSGSALAIVPAKDKYRVSLKYFHDVFEIDVKEEKNTLFTNTVTLKYPSSREYEMEKEEQAKRIATRDSLYAALEKMKEKTRADLQKQLILESADVTRKLSGDPHYFEKNNMDICAVLYRNKWKSKMIVTDVTGSMYPYMKQVALWHLLEIMNKERSDYVFFNDGDDQPEQQKVIGSTGGIYLNLNNSPDSVIKTMYVAMEKGSGGDSPENDIEALIKAVKFRKGNAELILIADHLSPVKDIELLKQIKIPVRVILCGASGGMCHPDYLEIAYKTGGSIHTIEEDITHLSALHNEETIIVAGTVYKFINGRFFAMTKRI